MRTLDDLRDGVSTLSDEGLSSVRVVREAFVAGTAPLQMVGSGSAADFIDRFGRDSASDLVRSTARLGLRTSQVGVAVQVPRPELDYVRLASDPTYGMLDSFYAQVVVSLPLKSVNAVAGLRLLRSNNGRIKVGRPAFSALIDGRPTRAQLGANDPIGGPAFQAAAIGVGNKLTSFLADDPFSSQRAVVSIDGLNPAVASPNTNRGATSAGLLEVADADRSVLEDLTFFINRRSVEVGDPVDMTLEVGSRTGISVLRGTGVTTSRDVVQSGNSAEFREMLRQPISSANWRRVGDFAEVSLFDPSVVFGNSYTYYVVAVSPDGTESSRSRMVTLEIRRSSPPASPVVSYSVVAGRPRFSVSVPGKFIDHVEVFRRGGIVPKTVRVLGSDGSMISDSSPAAVGGHHHIGDLGVSVDRSTTFIDTGVVPGQALGYRFYSVDSFGSKSQTPFECEIRLPDLGQFIPLAIPSITAEQGVGGRRVNVSVSCDDPRIATFVLRRREIGNSEYGYHEPTAPAYFRLGQSDPKRARSRFGPSLVGGSRAWSGVLLSSSGSAQMTDTAVSFDRTYQYIVEAVDVRGNRSSPNISKMVRVSVKPVADRPVDLSVDVIADAAGSSGVRITWQGGTDDFSPNELVGDQDVLEATAVRSVYQVERREVGKAIWEVMPATTSSEFIDVVSDAAPPLFRPSYAVRNAEYDYRVIAMQSGGFISNYTDPVRVIVSPDPTEIRMLWVRSTSTGIDPCHVIVSWNSSIDSIDGWEIERAAVNKLYAASITSTQSDLVRALSYSQIAKVRRESSRAHGLASQPLDVDSSVFVGNRYYVDQDVSLDNSYFYRVRQLDVSRVGPWTYAGISMSDSPHDRKLLSMLSDDEKVSLSRDPRPITRGIR